MEKVSKNNIIVTGLFPRRLSRTSSTSLESLNHDCLREIFHHLDLAEQFSLLRSSQRFFNVILYDIWYRYYDDTFDITKDKSIAKQTENFQTDFLTTILENFARIRGISLEILRKCLSKSLTIEFTKIVSLSINNCRNKFENPIVLNEFYKFPYLQDLTLHNICLEYKDKGQFLNLKCLHLIDIAVEKDLEGHFFKNVFSCNLEKLTLQTFSRDPISLKYFSNIFKCLHLNEVSLSTHYLYDHRNINCILNLPSLQILTLASEDNFYFSSKDHTIFYEILKIFSDNPFKSLKGLHINGMPEKIFYLCPYLQNITSLNWIVTKIFHRKVDGTVEWKSDIAQVIKAFYDFVVTNKDLRDLFVKDNIFHKKRVIKEVNFVERLHDSRRTKGFKTLNIVNSYKECCDLTEGSIRFISKSKK